MERRQFMKALAAAPLLKYAALPALAADDAAITHVPDWPGAQFDCSVLADRPIDEECYNAVRQAMQRLADREGRSFKLIGKHVGRRYDLPKHPWQLYVAVG